jgi:RNA polymerase sigma-70 factor (ECF subfamily)
MVVNAMKNGTLGAAMNVSSGNRETAKPGTEPKQLNPDVAPQARSSGGGFMVPPGQVTPRQSPSDEELVEQYRTGRREAFACLVERYQRELYHFLVRFVGNRAAAEDVFQEAFLQVHQSADLFDTQRRFRPWLFTIAANKARDMMRSQARRPTNPLQASIDGSNEEGSGQFIDLMEAATMMPDQPLETEEVQQQVQKTIMSMPGHLREILLLSYFHQFPYKAIADILGIPLGTVKSRLHAAVAQFAERWQLANHRHSLS